MKHDNIQFSLQDPELPSRLKDARKNHGGMTVPEDFFAQFEKKMNAVIDAEQLVQKRGESPVLQPKKASALNPRRWMNVAAAVVLVVGVALLFQYMRSGSQLDEASSHALASMDADRIEMQLDAIELPEQVADEVLTSVSDYEVFDIYCDL